MGSINNLLKITVSQATYWLELEVVGSVGNVYTSTITVWVKYRNSWGENARHCGLVHVIEVVIGLNRLYSAIKWFIWCCVRCSSSRLFVWTLDFSLNDFNTEELTAQTADSAAAALLDIPYIRKTSWNPCWIGWGMDICPRCPWVS